MAGSRADLRGHCTVLGRRAMPAARLDFQLTPDERGGMSGLVLVHAASPVTSESERR